MEKGMTGSNMGPHIEVAKPAIFNGEAENVGGFVTTCRLYLRMKIREVMVEEQVFWILSHVQEGSVDIWKENIMEELETGEMEYEIAEELLTVLKKKFGGGEEETVKAAELRKLEQGGRMMEEVVRSAGQSMGVPPRQDSYVIEVDWGRNCYACRGFGHMAYHCRNQGQRGRVAKGRRLEYRGRRIEEINEHLDNLKEVENLESLD